MPGDALSQGKQALASMHDGHNEPMRAAQTRLNKMRGLMADAGRVPESMEYYRRLIDFCAEWEFNTLQFRVADDQGTALRFASVPDLITHRNAFTAEQLHSLAVYGQAHGIDVIPELESFGHTGFITRAERYRHLLDSDARGDSEFSGVSPVDPESLDLFSRLFREVATIFPSKYLHGGCDEVNWGGSARSRDALKKKSRGRIWADYLNALNQVAKALNKDFVVWGDFVLHKQPDILSLLSKDIILMDWDYAEKNQQKVAKTLQTVLDNGSRCIGAPALSCYRWGARVGVDQLENVEAFSDAYLDDPNPRALGVMVTNWIPSRYLQNSVWDGFAYSAVAMKEGRAVAQAEGFRRFVERHYQVTWDDRWREIFRVLYNEEASFSDAGSMKLALPWSSDAQLVETFKRNAPRSDHFAHVRELLVAVEPSVKRSHGDFQSFQLCVRYLDAVHARNAAVMAQAAASSAGLAADTRFMQELAGRDQSLAAALEADWNHGRPANAPATVELLFDLQPKDQLLFQWKRAADYSASLAAHPEKFRQLATAAAAR